MLSMQGYIAINTSTDRSTQSQDSPQPAPTTFIEECAQANPVQCEKSCRWNRTQDVPGI